MNKKQLSNIDNLFREMTQNGFTAGVNALIIKDGKEIGYYEAGLRDVENNLPIERDTIYRLYSMSKPITSCAAMILLQEGKLDLLDPVCKFLPGFHNQFMIKNGKEIPLERDVNIQDLLNMTSGISYPGEGNPSEVRMGHLMDEIIERLYTDHPLSTTEIANRSGKCPVAFMPGSFWRYGFSADILGAVIETISGQKFGDFLKERIFDPLDMKDTGFYVPEEKQNRLARIYKTQDNGTLERYLGHNLGIMNDMKNAPAFESGGAGLVSTIDDYSHFSQMLLNQGTYNGKQILAPAIVDFMTGCRLTMEQQEGLIGWDTMAGHTYTNLLRIMNNPEDAVFPGSIGEYGWDGWLGAYFANIPEFDMSILMMYQKVDAGTTELTRKFRNIVFGALE